MLELKPADEVSAYFESYVFLQDCSRANINSVAARGLRLRILARLGYSNDTVDDETQFHRLMFINGDGRKLGPYPFPSAEARERYRKMSNEVANPQLNIVYADPGSEAWYDPSPMRG